MSKVIPPLLSTTPPPIAEEIGENDDEFGDFTVACSELPNGCDALSLSNQININSTEKDFQDRRKVDDNIVVVNSISYSKIQVASKFSNFQYIPDVPPDDDYVDVPDGFYNNTNDDDVIEAVVSNVDCMNLNVSEEECPTQSSDSDIFEACNDIVTLSIEHNHNVETIEQDNNCMKPETPEVQTNLDVGELQSQLINEDDDFGSFTIGEVNLDIKEPKSNVTENSPIDTNTNFGDFEGQTFEEDEFGDFNNYAIESTGEFVAFVDADEVKTVICKVFPVYKELIDDYRDQDFTSNNIVFTQLKDIADTNALLYQWPKSKSQNHLLSALRIDMRNILYGPRWNESMPRYAATLGFQPLEPTKSDKPPPVMIEPTTRTAVNQTTEIPPVQLQNEIPSAQFDWDGSGLVNPLETVTPKESNSEKKTVSTTNIPIPACSTKLPSSSHYSKGPESETVKSLNLNVTEVTSNVDDEFDDFTSYQVEKGISWVEKSIPLRETHIANQDVEVPKSRDEPGWLKPTILTPILTRKDGPSACLTNEVLDNWLQQQADQKCVSEELLVVNDLLAGTASKYETIMPHEVHIPQPTLLESPSPNILEVKIEVNNNLNEDADMVEQKESNSDDEFTDFQSSQVFVQEPVALPISHVLKPASSLMPDVLQPINIAGAATVIDWPDPGISDEDLKRFELIYQPAAEEDEWTDFVSNQASLDIKGPQEHQVARHSKLTTPNGIHKLESTDDEWSDFVSGPPIVPNGMHPLPQKVNLDFNRPPQFSSWTSNVTPNIITNPAAFDSFQNYNASPQIDLLKNRLSNKKVSTTVLQSKKNTIPSISSIPDLEFIVPKSHTWKK